MKQKCKKCGEKNLREEIIFTGWCFSCFKKNEARKLAILKAEHIKTEEYHIKRGWKEA